MSHPSWVRGLKFIEAWASVSSPGVAPFMGAWIEITSTPIGTYGWQVAPFMGAWIEIGVQFAQISDNLFVAPFMGAWIEITDELDLFNVPNGSHPSWVRGLKYKRDPLRYVQI